MAKKPNQRDTERLQKAEHHIQLEEYAAAELLCRQILRRLPGHFDALRLLGALLARANRKQDALAVFARASFARPDHAETHYNVGSLCEDLGQLDKAADSYRRALSIDRHFSLAHACLGAVLKKQRKPEESVACYQRALALAPAQAIWLFNYSQVLDDVGALEESIGACLDVIDIDPGFLDAYYELARRLQGLQRHAESRTTIDVGLQSAGENSTQRDWLLVLKAIAAWIDGDVQQCAACLQQGARILLRLPREGANHSLSVYWFYLSELVAYRCHHPGLYDSPAIDLLHIIGDSHSLAPSGTHVRLDGARYRVMAHLLQGCKAWHLAADPMNQYKRFFAAALGAVPDGARLIVSIGEIDCRYDEGVFRHYRKSVGDLEQTVARTVRGYVGHVLARARARNIHLMFCGIPAPRADSPYSIEDDYPLYLSVVRLFNSALQSAALDNGAGFIDVYRATAGESGASDGAYHIDGVHLKPDFLGIALSGYLAG